MPDERLSGLAGQCREAPSVVTPDARWQLGGVEYQQVEIADLLEDGMVVRLPHGRIGLLVDERDLEAKPDVEHTHREDVRAGPTGVAVSR
ncbi:MAG: hypothetical protein OXH09_15795 [Gammaproteobacteria bacterium]|nr:hypothetical protein [Gammaproteobacteria bacterium]